jgi:periplasmic divalent cation tolerance protein
MSEHRITYVTVPAEVAERMATTLVEERLAMCVSIIDHVRSIFRWEGQVEKANESLLVVKATAEKTGALIEKIQEIHPYEMPEVLSVDISAGNKDYLEWLAGKEIVIEEAELELDEELEDEEGEEEETEEKEA